MHKLGRSQSEINPVRTAPEIYPKYASIVSYRTSFVTVHNKKIKMELMYIFVQLMKIRDKRLNS